MDINLLPTLKSYINRRLVDPTTGIEERAEIENIVLDERMPQPGIDLYGRHLTGTDIADLDDWHFRHGNYVTEHLCIDLADPTVPWTFRPENTINRLRQIDPRLYLIRVENAFHPCNLSGISPVNLPNYVNDFKNGVAGAGDFLEGFVNRWNIQRDKRPLFATTELEVKDIFKENLPNWAEHLRDRLGLGHYSPGPANRPFDIMVMRYTVEEVLNSFSGNSYPAIPTTLDSRLNPYFFPSPIPTPDAGENPYFGHTVNMTLTDREGDYEIGIELLHPRIEYRPEHIYRVGVISQPVTMSLERARQFHLPWVRLHSGRDDFGINHTGVVR